MRCPRCQLENREEAKFCNECGYKFERACPKCRNFNRPESKFCDQCGHDLSQPFVSKESLESSQQPDLPLDIPEAGDYGGAFGAARLGQAGHRAARQSKVITFYSL